MDNKKQPNLEDLLKLKKAEQPNELFWETFDRELQKKALQTFIEKEPWYRNWAHCLSQSIQSTSLAYGLIILMGVTLFLNLDFENHSMVTDRTSNNQEFESVEAIGSENALVDYAIVANDRLEKDYAVEIITIKGSSEDYDFEADAISVAIGDTADYSDAPVYASSDALKISNQYTQLASFAF